MDGSQLTFDQTISVLKAEGYDLLFEEGSGPFKFILIDNLGGDVKTNKDCGYYPKCYSDEESLECDLGCIFCGGMYTTVLVYQDQKNITNQYNFKASLIQPGNELID